MSFHDMLRSSGPDGKAVRSVTGRGYTLARGRASSGNWSGGNGNRRRGLRTAAAAPAEPAAARIAGEGDHLSQARRDVLQRAAQQLLADRADHAAVQHAEHGVRAARLEALEAMRDAGPEVRARVAARVLEARRPHPAVTVGDR